MVAIAKGKAWKCICCSNRLSLAEIFLIGNKGVLCLACFNQAPDKANGKVDKLSNKKRQKRTTKTQRAQRSE